MKRILQMCLLADDNLGDKLGFLSLSYTLEKMGIEAEIDRLDLKPFFDTECWYDNQVPHLNRSYDLLVLGAGGLLGLKLVGSIFQDPASWQKITIPIVFFGVGVIRNHPTPQDDCESSFNYTLLSADLKIEHTVSVYSQSYLAALNAATLISVRDTKSWFLVQKHISEKEKLFLTGCPTLFVDQMRLRNSHKQYDLALNIPVYHGMTCLYYENQLSAIAAAVLKVFERAIWICHSEAEAFHARVTIEKFNLTHVALVYPKTFSEVANVYSQCSLALVTKLHAALFCLAQNIPFGMISYDIKCDALLEMLYDHPDFYRISLCDMEYLNLDLKLTQMLKRLIEQRPIIEQAQQLLLTHLRAGQTQFEQALLALLKSDTIHNTLKLKIA